MKSEVKKRLIRLLYRKMLGKFLRYFYDTPYIIGDKNRLQIGERTAVSNTIFNLASGRIKLGNRTIIGQNVMLLTGRHEFRNGKRISLDPEFDDGSWGGNAEVPTHGFDIEIGDGVFIASGSIIIGPCKIGSHSIVAAGAVVTKSFPDYSFLAGVPARRIRDIRKSQLISPITYEIQ